LYGTGDGPGIYRSVEPAWGDANLREIAEHIESPLFLTHVQAAIGSPVQATNCHPFRHGRWLFVHNGFIADFHLLRRDVMFAIDPALFATMSPSERPVTAAFDGSAGSQTAGAPGVVSRLRHHRETEFPVGVTATCLWLGERTMASASHAYS
jgi:predicted glutamine amidotransferase